MTEQLLNHINRHNLCKTTDKILLAVSGGIDSMVMLHLFQQAGYNIGVAHCNFQLRGEASDADEELLRSVCRASQVDFHVRRFDTENYANEKRLSIQMAARELRYAFFESLIKSDGYDYIATAHHHNDSVETLLLNLIKGTGLEGLTGIPVKQGNVIRPMLFATREMIVAYAKTNHITWREDVSNQSDDYQRNYLRHNVIPHFLKINPGFDNTSRNTLKRFAGSNEITKRFVETFASEAVIQNGDQIFIDKRKLEEAPASSVLLWALIKDKGFNFDQCESIVEEHQAGRKFSAGKYDLFIDRTQYIISVRRDEVSFSVHLDRPMESVESNGKILQFEVVAREKFLLDKTPSIAQFDADKIQFPLIWRSWRVGDAFVPFGVTHSRKVSDLLIDLKVPLPAKRSVSVIEAGGEILWVVGYRISNKFCITENTSKVLLIRCRNKD